MGTRPTLSIIVPIYQAEVYLNTCIDSILTQSFDDFELLLIDDGSMDKSGEIADSYLPKDPRVKVVHQKNIGQAGARNTGIKMALGHYIGFVDNDDRIHQDMFKVLIDNIQKCKGDISAASFIQEDESGNISHNSHTYNVDVFNNPEGIKELLLREKLDIYVWTKIYRKSFLDEHCILFEVGKNDEDMLFNYLAYTHARVSIVQDYPVYIYKHRESSQSRIYPKKQLEKYLMGTTYRVNLIEQQTKQNYPELLYLAQRQRIIYSIQMLSAIIHSDNNNANEYYTQIMNYLKKNYKAVIANKVHLGMSYIGIILMLVLPNGMYIKYRRLKEGVS